MKPMAPDDDRLNRGGKSSAAFRTISEVSADLAVPQHVLRFWETRFSQLRPTKGPGRRRYYRPDDIVLLRRIRDLLYGQGYTIKGAQKFLRLGPAVEEAAPHAEAAAPAPKPAGRAKAGKPATRFAEIRAELESIQKDLREIRELLRGKPR